MNARAGTMISTVGTSLLANLRREGWDMDNEIAVVKGLQGMDPAEKLLGAEINSNHSILQQERLEPERLYLCVSDTPDGERIGRLLQQYYRDLFEQVEVIKITGLQSEDPRRFRNQGLRNLVREIADIVKREREHGRDLIINATGGFKAQISFAGLIGQVLEIPVFYMFENFSEVIELPSLPVSFNFDFWLSRFDVLQRLSQDLVPEQQVPPDLNEVLLLREEGLCCLSSLGELFHRGYLERFRSQRAQLLPADSSLKPEEKPIKYEDGNEGQHSGLPDYLRRLLHAGYVTRIRTYYHHPSLPERRRFFISAKCDPNEIEGWYSDGKATTKFILATTAQKDVERQAALVELTERFAA